MHCINKMVSCGKKRNPPRPCNDKTENIGIPIPGFPERYTVCTEGFVYGDGRRLCGHLHRKGYQRVQIWRNGVGRHEYVHKLVARAFHGRRPDGWHVDHLDFDKTNNRPDNLRYLPAHENTARRKRRGLKYGNIKNEIINAKGSCREVAKKFGVDPTTVSRYRRMG